MSDRIEYAYTSNIGRRRGSNEDNFWIGGESLPMLNKGTEGVLEGTFSDDSLFFAGSRRLLLQRIRKNSYKISAEA